MLLLRHHHDAWCLVRLSWSCISMHHDVSTAQLLATWRAIFQRAATRLSGVLACQNLYRIRYTCIWRYTLVCVGTPYCVIEHQNLHSRYTCNTQSGSLCTLSAAFIQLVGYSSPCDALLCGYPLAIFGSRILPHLHYFPFENDSISMTICSYTMVIDRNRCHSTCNGYVLNLWPL